MASTLAPWYAAMLSCWKAGGAGGGVEGSCAGADCRGGADQANPGADSLAASASAARVVSRIRLKGASAPQLECWWLSGSMSK